MELSVEDFDHEKSLAIAIPIWIESASTNPISIKRPAVQSGAKMF